MSDSSGNPVMTYEVGCIVNSRFTVVYWPDKGLFYEQKQRRIGMLASQDRIRAYVVGVVGLLKAGLTIAKQMKYFVDWH